MGKRSDNAFCLIRDIPKGEVDEYFPTQADMKALEAKYPIVNAKDQDTKINNLDYIYAIILYRLAADIETMSNFLDAINNNLEYQEIPKWFKT